MFDIGLCDTPAVYFATAFYDMEGSVMITASHNPPEYNGLKVSRRQAVPVGYEAGLADLERQVAAGSPAAETRPPARGKLTKLDIRADYVAHLARFRSDLSSLRIVIDCSNGMAGIFLRDVLQGTNGHFIFIGHGRHTGSGDSKYKVTLVRGGSTDAQTA